MVAEAGQAGADADLVAGLAAGDEAALASLYDRYGDMLYALASRILGDRDDAEEVVMTVFTQVWTGARGYRAERGSVATWLVMMARSRALDRLRSRQRQVRAMTRAATESGDAPGMSQAQPAADVSAGRGEMHHQVAAALRGLPDAQRTCIELAYYEGLTQSQIAERLREPLGTIKTRTRLAMAKLRDILLPLAGEFRA